MAEIESLATEEDLAHHLVRHGIDRLIMVSDGVFAIATTLAAIEIRLPLRPGSFAAVITQSGWQITAYLISFFIAAIFWIQHRDLFARLRRVDNVITVLTLALLCLIAMIPAVVHSFAAPGGTGVPLRVYAALMVSIGTLNLAMWLYAIARPGLMRASVPPLYRARRIVAAAVMPLLMLPAIFRPMSEIAPVIVALAVAAGLLGRVVLPGWMNGFPNRARAA